MKIKVLILLVVFLSGCATATQVATTVGVGSGVITPGQKHLIDTTAIHAEKAARPITETEEYYIGRGVAARILSQYTLYNHPNTMNYINHVGRALAMNSMRPYTYGGYHFAVLNTDEINAFACPGGMVFVTRGMLNLVKTEDELAAVIAHEVGHVNAKHGLKAISRARWTQVVTALGVEAAKVYSGAQLANLLELFEGTVDDVFKTLVVNGYGREDEFEADNLAQTILLDSGYDPNALTEVLANLEAVKGSVQGGIFATHPDMAARLGATSASAASAAVAASPTERVARFSQISASWEMPFLEAETRASLVEQPTGSAVGPPQYIEPAPSSQTARLGPDVPPPRPQEQTPARFDDGSFLDARTGLIWMEIPEIMTWDEARKRVFYVNSQIVGAAVEWHMPSVHEMELLLASRRQEKDSPLGSLRGTFWVDKMAYKQERMRGPRFQFCTYVNLDREKFYESNETLNRQAHKLLILRPGSQ